LVYMYARWVEMSRKIQIADLIHLLSVP